MVCIAGYFLNLALINCTCCWLYIEHNKAAFGHDIAIFCITVHIDDVSARYQKQRRSIFNGTNMMMDNNTWSTVSD